MSETTPEDHLIILHEFLAGNKAHATSRARVNCSRVSVKLHLSCTVCACNYQYSGVEQTTQERRLTGDKINFTKDRKVVWTKTSFDLGKNGCHRPSGLGGRVSVFSGSQINRLRIDGLRGFAISRLYDIYHQFLLIIMNISMYMSLSVLYLSHTMTYKYICTSQARSIFTPTLQLWIANAVVIDFFITTPTR